MSASVVGEFDASLRNVSAAAAAPAAFGVNVTLNCRDWPSEMLAGKVIPESTNSLLFVPPEETMIGAPAALRLALSVELDPTATIPKSSWVGETESWPRFVPVPERVTLRGELDASDTTESVLLAEPGAVGVKIVVKVTLWFAARVAGRLSPPAENAELPIPTPEIVIGVLPELVSVVDNFELPPTWTLPNAKLAGFAAILPALCGELPATP